MVAWAAFTHRKRVQRQKDADSVYQPEGVRESDEHREVVRRNLLRDEKLSGIELGGKNEWFFTVCKTHDDHLQSIYDDYMNFKDYRSRITWGNAVEEYVDFILEEVEKAIRNMARDTDILVVRNKILCLRKEPSTSFEVYGEYPTSREE